MHPLRLKDRRVLIVDDDPDILRSFEIAVRGDGAITASAGDGQTAIHMAPEFQPDAVILDMMLPRQSGFLVLEKLMELPDPPAVVMVTANKGKRHMEYAESLGVSAYLTKPVALQRLVDTLVELLEADGDPED
ncbi:MAG: response regulator [Phycisphaeraceae bacterium]|nr:response regulator [Phycisphaeraceae bacterium]